MSEGWKLLQFTHAPAESALQKLNISDKTMFYVIDNFVGHIIFGGCLNKEIN